MPDHRRGKVDHPAGDPAGGEKIAGEDEKRDRHDLEAINAGEQLQAHHFRVDVQRMNR